ncbi:hypothetical protein BD410DRAFT_622891 [Rickenella mellea]|uniref:Saccharopine dehydrogenase NADP binding domain-containing protein n=1 Tax=Rickenella mellea TaxID=50990 RepID=A0A4Y7PNM7_9AGAM|nr:hypothetical protein BD410DRAFT_622891 [Rickenella mellea]
MPDILVLGATGFTGRIVTRYLHTHPNRSSFSFAIGGRSRSKLSALVDELKLDESVEVIEFNANDDASVEVAVQRVKVVINMVGPYWLYGTPIVRACAKHGVHHVDITGETHWVKDIIEQFDSTARKTGSIIVPSCGFDSIPSDMSVHLSAKTLKTALGPDTTLGESRTIATLHAGVSGGTLASILTGVEEVPRDKLRAARLPYALSPIQGQTKPGTHLLYRLPILRPEQYGGQFPPAPHSIAMVHRTWALLQNQGSPASAYGKDFTYDEFGAAGGRVSAISFSLAMEFGLFCLLHVPPVRWLIKRVGPAAGTGPSDEALEKGSMEVINVTSTVPSPDTPQTHVKTVIRGRGDPGYILTSIMVIEAALCLLDRSKLPEIGRDGGILTPMTAFGDVLVERLKANERFEIESALVTGDEVDGKKTM